MFVGMLIFWILLLDFNQLLAAKKRIQKTSITTKHDYKCLVLLILSGLYWKWIIVKCEFKKVLANLWDSVRVYWTSIIKDTCIKAILWCRVNIVLRFINSLFFQSETHKKKFWYFFVKVPSIFLENIETIAVYL